MLSLKNVSKFYYNKGIVASGFSKVSLDLFLGEFVAITGESGSGKSTLLNVISGLDSYEEGEMYINGEETSHYNESDFEIYRKKYIGNIFQTFNLVNSYSVYQNIELVLLLNGFKKKDIKKDIIEIIKKVDLYKYRNTKVSKLSGGQKQRVAIARALAKNTPIIVADEPTGNLDSRSALSVLKLLHEISKDKLVIVVTHNFEQIEQYATRVIKMHDGRILEDDAIKKIKERHITLEDNYKDLTFFNKIRLGIRNAFNVIPKFVLLMIVYLFIVSALLLEYASTKKDEYETSLTGHNNYFVNTSDKRIIIKKKDKTSFSEEDYNKISEITNVSKIIKDDLLLDTQVSINDDDFYFNGVVLNINDFNQEVSLGRKPENEYEAIIVGSKNNYYLNEMANDLLDREFYINDLYSSFSLLDEKIKIVGIYYQENDLMDLLNVNFYVSDKILFEIRKSINKNYSTISSELNDYIHNSERYTYMYQVIPNDNVPSGQVYVGENVKLTCPKYKCNGNSFVVNVKNIYYSDQLNLTVGNEYTKNNFKKLLGLTNYDDYNGAFFVNTNDYYNMFTNKGYFQSSVFVNNEKIIDDTIEELNNMGIKGYNVSDMLVNYWGEEILGFVKIIKAVVTIGLSVALFFISYFIIKLILKSRNIYYSTVRILGASKKDTKQLLDIELLILCNLAFFLFVGFYLLVINNIIQYNYLYDMLKFLNIKDFTLIYVIIVIMTYLITTKYSRKLFKSSAMVSYRDEV